MYEDYVQEMENAEHMYLLANIGTDTAEKHHRKGTKSKKA